MRRDYKQAILSRLPVRNGVKEIECHRPPTAYEVKFGEGAIHYRTFTIVEACYKGTRILKMRFKADDGLFYSTR